ncbi:outer membrane beta-barrel protein [Granulicella rosea]|nr:outer membrane beta-barrel protein [Granulicella rosea]
MMKHVSLGILLLTASLARAESTGYAAPRLDATSYRGDPWRNKDGSYRYSLELGGGVALPAGATKKYQNTAGGFRLGGGYNLNRRLGIMLQYDFNNFGVPNSLLQHLPSAGDNYTGRVHLWSLTAAPVVQLLRSDGASVYLTGGGGFYRKLVKFDTTTKGCNPDGGCLNFPTYAGGDSNNAGGVSLGLGAAKKIAFESKVRVFAEARYVWIANTGGHPGIHADIANKRTGYFPILIGLKW